MELIVFDFEDIKDKKFGVIYRQMAYEEIQGANTYGRIEVLYTVHFQDQSFYCSMQTQDGSGKTTPIEKLLLSEPSAIESLENKVADWNFRNGNG